MQLSSVEVGIRSKISCLKEMFDQMNAHTAATGFDHRAKMVGALNQIILDCENLRESFNLSQNAPTDDVPEWMKQED